MFTKTRGDEPQETNLSAPNVMPRPAPSSPASGRPASLGPSISVSGNLSGNEDLIIEGAVEGEVVVKDHMVTISETGRVKADVYGRSICVEGQVDGNLVGDEQVVIRQSGRVTGNVTAPRVNLENGAKFKGSIDMQPAESAPRKPDGVKKPAEGTQRKKDERRRDAAGLASGTTVVGGTA